MRRINTRPIVRRLSAEPLGRANPRVVCAGRVKRPQLKSLMAVPLTDGGYWDNAVGGVCRAEVACRRERARLEVQVQPVRESRVADAWLTVGEGCQAHALRKKVG